MTGATDARTLASGDARWRPRGSDVRPTATASCASCGGSWPARTSRFCGRCGAALSGAPRGDGARSSSFRWVAAVAVALVALVGSGAVRGFSGTPSVDPVVELPAAAEVPRTAAMTDEEARAALAPFDPSRLRCEPVGCERWRFEAPQGGLTFTTFGDLLAVHHDGRLHGLDPQTGERRWSVPLSEPGGAGPAPRGVREEVLLAADDAHLVVARASGELRLVDTSGRNRWVTTVPEGARIGQADLVGEVVLTARPVGRPPDRAELLHAFDVADGSLRWSRTVDALAGPLRDLVVEDGDRGLVGLDPATGADGLHLAGGSWARRFGAVYLVGSSDDRAYPWLVDTTTATEHFDLDGHPAATLSQGGWLYLATSSVDVQHPEAWTNDAPADVEILGIDPQGEVRWRRDLELPWPAGPGDLAPWRLASIQLTVVDDAALAVHLEGRPRPWVLDLDDGADRTDVEPPDAPAQAWWNGEVAVVARYDGVELHGRGGTAWVPSRRVWLASDAPLVVGGTQGLLGVDLVAEG
jgi:hypothetical protein